MSWLNDFLVAFHFLRPWALLALIPALLVFIALWHTSRYAKSWQQLIAPELLPFLIDGKSTKNSRSLLVGLLLALIIACVAIAGPTFEQRSLPVQKNSDALVIVLDLSPSMLSEDIKPSRLIRARLKISDILRARSDGYSALVAYAGDAHLVTPLTDDIATITSLLPALSPETMPLQGSQTESGIELAIQLLKDAGNTSGQILLITDGVASSAVNNINGLLKNTHYQLSILGIGGTTPAPIPSSRGNFVRDNSNNVVTTFLDPAPLRELAKHNKGSYQTATNSNTDIDSLLTQHVESSGQNTSEQTFDQWFDRGHWLVLLLLPIALFSFRRGLIACSFLLCSSILLTPNANAFEFNDLWFSKDQQAQKAYQQQDYDQAAQLFENADWRASAHYRAKNYEAAAEAFSHNTSAEGFYNLGNSQFQLGKLDEAIAAYDEAIKQRPDFKQAIENRAQAIAAKEQQEQKQQQDKSDQDQESQDSDQEKGESQDQSDNGESSQDKSSEPSSSEQDSPDQSSSEKQSEPQDSQSPESSTPQEADSSDQPEDEKNAQQQADEQAADDEKTDQASAEEIAAEQEKDQQAQEQAAALAASSEELTSEEQQAMEQWLRQVPDDPSGLLRTKFRYQYEQKRAERMRNQWRSSAEEQQERW